MNEMTRVEHEIFGAIRAYNFDDSPWFVGSEAARMLQYKNPQEAVRLHVPARHRRSEKIATTGAVPYQKMTLISEAGLYRLIMRSNMPEAERFTDWVTEEVLPTLRKAHEHGIDAIGELKERVLYLEDELETERMTTDSEHIRNRKAFLDGVKAGRANPDVAYGLSAHFRQWEQG